MNVDKARGYQATGGVDLALAGFGDLAHLRDAITADRDVGFARGFSSAVDQGAIADDDVVAHVFAPVPPGR